METSVTPAKKVRDSYFDNFKAILIIGVFMGHACSGIGDAWFTTYYKYFCYIFLMPAFTFVSGYFCRKKPEYGKMAKQLLVPYALLQCAMILFSMLVWDKGSAKTLVLPAFTTWFLLALYFWRCGWYILKDIRWITTIMFVVALVVGYDTRIGDYLGLSRMFVFFPFFFLGNKFNKEKFMAVVNRWWVKVLAVLALFLIFLGTVYFHDDINFHFLEASTCYKSIKKVPLEWAWLHRAIYLALAAAITYLLAIIVPKKKCILSRMGRHSMIIYVTHAIFLRTIRYCTDWNEFFATNYGVFVLIAIIFIYCFVITSAPVVKFIGYITDGFWKLWDKFWGFMMLKKPEWK